MFADRRKAPKTFYIITVMLDPQTGTLCLPHNILLSSGTNFDTLKETLQEHKGIDFVCEERYGLYQIIYLSHVEVDGLRYMFEIFFDKKRLTSILMDFECMSAGNGITLEEWLTDQLGNLRQFSWGEINTIEHPKFCVPLISLKYS